MSINAVTYLTGNTTFETGMVKRGTMGFNIKPTLSGSFNWWNKVDALSTQYLIYTDSYTTERTTQANAVPVCWSTPDLNNQSFVNLVNTIPERIGTLPFTSFDQAYNWLIGTNKYVVLKDEYENIVTDGLVLNLDAGWYNSYPGSGTVWDDISGGDFDGTLTNGPSFSTLGQGSIGFDGVDDYVLGETITSTSGSNSRTFCVWFRATTNQNTSLWDKGSTGDGLADALYAAGSNGVGSSPPSNPGGMYVVFWNQDFYIPIGQANVFDGDWHFAAYTYNSSNNTMTFCFDGTFPTTAYRWNNAWTTQTTQPFTMSFALNTPNSEYWVSRSRAALWGIGSTFGQSNVGAIQQYNRVLSATEILQNYNTQKYRFSSTATTIVTEGLVMYLDAGNPVSYPQTGTNWFDLSGYNNSGTLINGPTYSSGNGGVILFDGTDDNVSIPTLTWTPTAFSVLWFVNGDNRLDFNQVIGAQNNWGSFLFHTTSTGGVFCGIDVATRFTPTQLPANTFVTNVYQMFCFTFDNGSTNFYKNGTLLASKSMNMPSNWGGFLIGSADGSTIDGAIGNVLIYNKALNGTEVTQNFNSLKTRFGL